MDTGTSGLTSTDHNTIPYNTDMILIPQHGGSLITAAESTMCTITIIVNYSNYSNYSADILPLC